MKISLPYEQHTIEVDIADDKVAAVLEPNELPGCTDAAAAVREAAAHPVGRDAPAAGVRGAQSFQEFLSAPGRLLVIVNDGTRPTPTAAVLETLAEQLDKAAAQFIIATGVHRAPSETELRFIFGATLERFRSRITVHDARADRADATYSLGTTSRGTEVLLNTAVRDAERVLIIGSVEPHYFAGYTGGRKGFLPGVAAYSTIEQNHKLALSPEAKTLALGGNPVHEDMIEACRLIDKNVFTFMTVLDREQKLHAVTAGGLEDAFGRAVELAAGIFVTPLAEAADVVIACAKYPMDIDLYQSQKAIENARLALKHGGALILVSSCRDGIGEDAFRKLLASCESPGEVFEKIEAGYKLGYHKAAKIADICARADVMAYSGLAPELLESVFIKPVKNLQRTLDELTQPEDVKVVIMPDASVTVPLCK